MKLPPITKTQHTILSLIYRYRFMERQHIQTYLGHKDKRRVSSWLKDLREKHYLEWVYDPNDFVERIKPADYYLGINGIRYLQATGEYPASELRKRYRDADRSAGFRARCVLLVEVCIDLMAASDEMARYACLTPTEYAYETSAYYFLQELGPHLCFTKHEGATSTNYLLEVFDATLPRYRFRKRLKDYLIFLAEGEWESERDDAPPTILFVCPTTADLIYAKRRIRWLLESEWETEDIHFRLTTTDKLKQQGIIGEIWESV